MSTPSKSTLDARRAHGEALVQAADKQRAQRLAAAEAQAAEQEVVRRSQAERLATLASELDKVDAFLDEQRRQQEQAASAAEEHQRQTMERARAFINEPPPHVPLNRDEQAALLAQLNAAVARDDAARAAREEQEERERIDREWRRRQARTLGTLRDERDRQEQEREGA